jgi:uracil-DNA glycosylase
MTAVIYNFHRPVEDDTADDAAERLFSALGRYTSAELLELLYVGEEPGFFELMRGLFGLSDEGRMVLQNFLAASVSRRTTVSIDRQGRCVLANDPAQDLAQDHPARDHRHQSRARQQGPA